MVKNFAVIGCAGFVAPRHLQAIKDTRNRIIAATDPSDSVGVLDRYSDDIHYFPEFERFARHAHHLCRRGEDERIHYVSVCSPNYSHDAHVRFAFEIGADAICEKPLVITPRNLDALEEDEREAGQRVFSVLQLRYNPDLKKLKERIDCEEGPKKHDVELTYITPRGRWYNESWKGNHEKSGGLVTNLGVHFFDMLGWIFGGTEHYEVHHSDRERVAGFLELERARVRWFLSIKRDDLPEEDHEKEMKPYRSIIFDGKEIPKLP